MSRRIFLSESSLFNAIRESVRRVLRESYGSSSIDWNNVDEIDFKCWYDEDDLSDAIDSGELDRSNESEMDEWFYDNLFFDIVFKDNDYNVLGYIEDTCAMFDSYGIPDEYIKMIVDTYKSNPQLNHEYYISDVSYEMANRMGNVDDACKRMFSTSDEYCKGMHGFVLKDGTIILMPQGGDHNSIECVNGVSDKWQFVEDGNPSILGNNLRVGGVLTSEQESVIGRMIRCYSDDELYVSFLGGPKGEQSCCYKEPDYRRVLSDIDSYYDEGIIPTGDGF